MTNTDQECVCCYDANSSVLFYPCEHMVCCMQCVVKMSAYTGQFCPICRSPVNSTSTIHQECLRCNSNCCMDKSIVIIQKLLNMGAPVNEQTDDGATPLFLSSQGGLTKIVSFLIDNGALVNMKRHDKMTPLLIACRNGHKDTVGVLLRNGACVNAENIHGITGLYLACINSNLDIVSLLVKGGACVNAPNTSCRGFALLLAC